MTKQMNNTSPITYQKQFKNALTVMLDENSKIIMHCQSRGLPLPTTTWSKNEKPLEFDINNSRISLCNNNQTLEIDNLQIDDDGSYSCTSTNRINNVTIPHTDLRIRAANEESIPDNGHDTSTSSLLIFCITFPILITFLMIFVIMYIKRRRKWKPRLRDTFDGLYADIGLEEQVNLLPYDERYEFSKDKLKLGKLLGHGEFGVVYKAEAFGIIEKNITTTVAVKKVKPKTCPTYVRNLASELKIMIQIGRHLNIVNLLGSYTGNKIDENLMVVVEYCCFGNTRDYLMKKRENFVSQITADGYLDWTMTSSIAHCNPGYGYVLSTKFKNVTETPDDGGIETNDSDVSMLPCLLNPTYQYHENHKEEENFEKVCTHDLVCWSFQVAWGMEYLASKKILHSDLAARNILLAEGNIVKICDFGLAKSLKEDDIYTQKSQVNMPVRWMAIESLRFRKFSTKSDVWSFGVVMWEFFSLGLTPYPNVQSYREQINLLTKGYRLENPVYANLEIYDIMLSCWNADPNDRPSFIQLAERIGNLLKDGVKLHYIRLNEEHEKINNIKSKPGCLSCLIIPKCLGCATAGCTSNTNLHNSDQSNGEDNLNKKKKII